MSSRTRPLLGGEDVGGFVLDFGSDTVRFGNIGEPYPRCVVKSKILTTKDAAGDKIVHAPVNLFQPRQNCEVENLVGIQEGSISIDKKNFEVIAESFFNEKTGIGMGPGGKPVLLSDFHYKSLSYREPASEVLFESFSTEAIFFVRSSVLSLFSVGRSTGCVLDLGASFSSVVPIYEGFALEKTSQIYPIGGHFLTKYIDKELHKIPNFKVQPTYNSRTEYSETTKFTSTSIIKQTGPSVLPTDSYQTAATMNCVSLYKESIAKVEDSLEIVQHGQIPAGESTQQQYRILDLPDRTPIMSQTLGSRIGEFYFNPKTVFSGEAEVQESKFEGIIQTVIQALKLCDPEVAKDIMGTILLAGGGATIPKLAERVLRELPPAILSSIGEGGKPRVVAPSPPFQRKFAAFVGASMLGSLSTFQQNWVSKEEYKESGMAVISRKCAA